MRTKWSAKPSVISLSVEESRGFFEVDLLRFALAIPCDCLAAFRATHGTEPGTLELFISRYCLGI